MTLTTPGPGSLTPSLGSTGAVVAESDAQKPHRWNTHTCRRNNFKKIVLIFKIDILKVIQLASNWLEFLVTIYTQLFFFSFIKIWGKVLQCSAHTPCTWYNPHWPWMYNPPASASQMLWLRGQTTMPDLHFPFGLVLFILLLDFILSVVFLYVHIYAPWVCLSVCAPCVWTFKGQKRGLDPLRAEF